MLWYKAWLETRSRFLASLVGITVIIAFLVHHAESLFPAGPKTAIYHIVFFAHQYLMGMWILCAILLGMGGLLRERATGTSLFTLALPVSRSRLMGVRIALGLLESVLLALVPWVAILVISDFGPAPFPLSQAAFYLLLLVSGGSIYFAMAVLISSSIEGEYTAPAVAYGITILTGVLFGNVAWLRPYADIWRFIGGDNHLNKSSGLLLGPFPWIGALSCGFATAIMLLASAVIIRAREF